MTPLFTINFRREVYQRELAKTRRRVMLVGLWVSYFGMIVVLLGLYGLNFASLTRRVQQIERQTAFFRQSQGQADWSLRETELAQIVTAASNPRKWRDRLGQGIPGLSRADLSVFSAEEKVTSIAVNPQNLSHPLEQNRLVITGTLRPTPGQDRMQSVMAVVNVLHADSLFSAGYQNVKLASTRVAEEGGTAEFVIECR